MPLPARRFRFAAATSVVALTAALTFTSLPAQAEPSKPGASPAAVAGRYIITLKGAPIATYGGEVKGLEGTRPAAGRKVNAGSSNAKRYRAYLERQQDRAAGRVGAKADKRYAVALNGCTARLTSAQARTLQRSPGVLSVVKDTPRRLLDDKNPVDFLQLSGPNGAWQSLGGKSKAGAGVVVGVLDTGYWPESASFDGSALGTTPATTADPYRPYKLVVGSTTQIRMTKSDGGIFTGECEVGENSAADFDGTECNTKVISARYFNTTYKDVVEAADRNDFMSPRDRDGHGSHTASTAAGNADKPVTIRGRSFGKISGVAPAAKVAVYNVCWTSISDPEGACYNGDSLDAVEQAVLDGVDVINYSVSSSDSLDDPVDQAFRAAAAAG
ncbi:MAG TPA: S8 family serine peptidase, partial [Propionibacteriaceae bacterium]|nr:S8 family serine peptidase [Propionibacteriaceae bacterium]